MSRIQTLSLALRNRGEEGEPLPPLFNQLEMLGMKFRRGWLHLIAGAAGGGKSSLLTFLTLKLKLPTLYFSPDNDAWTWGKNALALTTDEHVNQAESWLNKNPDSAYTQLDETTDHLWVSFQAAPSPRDVREELDAFAAVWGDWPEVLVIDNLMNLDASDGGPDERTSQSAVLEFLKVIARETGAAIFVLSHVTGQYADGTTPIPRSGLINKVDKLPQVILTLYRADTNLLGVSVVKNRGGRAMADGSLVAEIPWLAEKSWMHTGVEQ